MRVSGAHRPSTAHDEPPADSIEITADGADFAAARQLLIDQVPEGHQLLSILVER